MVKPRKINKVSRWIDSFFAPLIQKGIKYGIKADHISLLQIPLILGLFLLLGFKLMFWSATVLGFIILLDVLDGSWARVGGQVSERGHIYDKVLDLLGISVLLVGIGWNFVPIYLPAVLALETVLLYILNRYGKPELYCGVRPFGFLGLLFKNLTVFLLISGILGGAMIGFKLTKKAYLYVKS